MTVSITLAAFGIVLSALVILRFGNRWRSPERDWFVGVGAIAPAWLVSLLVFLTGLGAAEKGVRVYLAGAAAAAILGVIVTEYCVRRLQSNSKTFHPTVFWLLGMLALAPSWLVLLRGIVAR